MNSLPLDRPGEGKYRAVAIVIAIGLPLLAAATLGDSILHGSGVLALLLPVLLAAGLGGSVPGLLATAASAIPAAFFIAPGAVDADLGWLALFVVLAVLTSVLFGRTWRRQRHLLEERDRIEAEKRFHESIASLAGDCAWQARLSQGRLMLERATPGFPKSIGMTIDEVNARGGLSSLVVDEDRPAMARHLQALAEGGQVSAELRFDVRRGIVRYQCEMRALGDSLAGEEPAVVGCVRDITARYQLVDQLREAKERYESTVMAARLVLFDYDYQTRQFTFGGDAERVLGRWPAELGGPLADWVQRVHPADAGRFEQALLEAHEPGHALNVEYRVRHADGRYVTVHQVGDFGAEERAPRRRLSGFMRDVTDARRGEQALRRREENLRFALGASRAGVWEWDYDCEEVMESSIAGCPLGLPLAADDRRNALDRVHPADREALVQAFLAGAEGRAPYDREFRTVASDGAVRWLRAVGRRVDDDERGARFAGATVDVTTQRAAQEEIERLREQLRSDARGFEAERSGLERELRQRLDELKQTDRRRDEFLATLAHELRNPLAPIRNASMLLGLQDGSQQSIDWVRRVIDRQTDHLARLIDDLLDVSRLTRDRMTLRLERVELARVVDNAIDAVRSQIDAQRHRLTVDVPAGLWLQGDQIRLTQVFSNLLNNAVKYTSAGGAIELKAEQEGDWVSVAVRDNGVGIPSDQLEHLFEMFYQVDRTIERAHAGLGIGLTLVERLVRLHGGQVTARSEGIGRGSEFVVRLPLADRPAQPESPAAAPAGRAVRGLRILVADDSVDSALTLTALLSAAGHDVQAVHDGFAALQRAAEFRPQVMVLDIGMPGLNGYDTCRRIRAEPWGRNAVIIAVTGWGADEDRRRSREAGFDAHLVKPVDYTELQRHFTADKLAT